MKNVAAHTECLIGESPAYYSLNETEHPNEFMLTVRSRGTAESGTIKLTKKQLLGLVEQINEYFMQPYY